MSILPKESIEVIAQSIGINNLSPDVALALAPDVEYRLREVMQEAIKCMRHSRRTRMTPDDVDGSLSIKNVESQVVPISWAESDREPASRIMKVMGPCDGLTGRFTLDGFDCAVCVRDRSQFNFLGGRQSQNVPIRQ